MTWPLTPVVVGDLITATQLNQLPIALAKVSPGGGSSFSFDAIPADWTNLTIIACLQSSATPSAKLKIKLNSTASSAYNWQRFTASGTTVAATNGISQDHIDGGEVPGAGSGGFSVHSIYLPNYALLQPHQVAVTGYGCWDPTVGTGQMLFQTGGLWKPVTDVSINSVKFSLGAGGTFSSGCIVMLYGGGQF